MDMYVVCENRRGKVQQAAAALSEAAAAHGIATLVRSIDETVLDDLLASDIVVAGCQVHSDVPFGGEPTKRLSEWIGGLPDLDGRSVGVFCTYTFFPHTFADTTARVSKVLAVIGGAFEAKGARVVATQGLHQGEFPAAVDSLVSKVIGATRD